MQAHCERIGLPAEVERTTVDPGVLHLRAASLSGEPLVSIVIPTAGQQSRWCASSRSSSSSTASAASSSARPTTTTRSSASSTTRSHRRSLDELSEIAGDRLRLVPFDGPFDFSAKINLGAVHSEGEHLLLLNDDIEVTTPDWLERMVMYSDSEGIGAVGAKLLWGDTPPAARRRSASTTACPGTSTAASPRTFAGYANACLIARNCLAVTGACLMTPRATSSRRWAV